MQFCNCSLKANLKAVWQRIVYPEILKGQPSFHKRSRHEPSWGLALSPMRTGVLVSDPELAVWGDASQEDQATASSPP